MYVSIWYFQDHYKVNEVLISKGSRGALYYDGKKDYYTEAMTIKVGDTVGSGDAFLAGFISKRIKDVSLEETMCIVLLRWGHL